MAWRLGAVVVAAALALPAPVAAQGAWLPWGGQRPQARTYAPPHASAPAWSPYHRPYVAPYARPYSPYAPHRPGWDLGDDGPAPAAGYRTLCVRLCDGYYFPMSFAADGSALARDADRCAASCGSEARLFYHPNPGGSVEEMVDLTGMAYAALPNAFRYRKTLVEGCSCRPLPWTAAERARHLSYAATEPEPHAAPPGPEPHAAPPGPEAHADALPRPAPVERRLEPSAPFAWSPAGAAVRSGPRSRHHRPGEGLRP